jgi:hypothetical protein
VSAVRPQAARSLPRYLQGALARGLLHIGKDHGGQFLMSPGEQFRMSLDSAITRAGWGKSPSLRLLR